MNLASLTKANMPLFLIATATVVAASEPQHPTQGQEGKIEIAADAMCLESLNRSRDLDKQLDEFVHKLQAFILSMDRKQPKMTPDQQDKYASLTAQIRRVHYLQRREVYTRRRLEEIHDLAEVERINDEEFANLVSSGSEFSVAQINQEIDRRSKDRLGDWAAVWKAAGDELEKAHQYHVALTIPFEGLVGRLRASAVPSASSDDLELFFAEGDLSQSVPYRLFYARTIGEIAKGNKEAEEVKDFLDNQWRVVEQYSKVR